MADLPDIATVERRKDRQQKKVYVDVLQNTRGHHVVHPYVLRVLSRATVSMPLTWAELTPGLQPQRYNLKTIFRHGWLGKRLIPWHRSWPTNALCCGGSLRQGVSQSEEIPLILNCRRVIDVSSF